MLNVFCFMVRNKVQFKPFEQQWKVKMETISSKKFVFYTRIINSLGPFTWILHWWDEIPDPIYHFVFENTSDCGFSYMPW